MAAHLTDSSAASLFSFTQVFVRRAPCHTGTGVSGGQQGDGWANRRGEPGGSRLVSAPGSSQGKSACHLCATVHKTASCTFISKWSQGWRDPKCWHFLMWKRSHHPSLGVKIQHHEQLLLLPLDSKGLQAYVFQYRDDLLEVAVNVILLLVKCRQSKTQQRKVKNHS